MESYCRLCAKSKSPSHLLYNLTDIRDKLVECCQWPEQSSPNDAKLPQNVCDLCCLQLEQYRHFKKSVSDAQNELEHLISQSDDGCAVPVVDVVANGEREILIQVETEEIFKEEPSLEVIEWNTIEPEVDCINTDGPQSSDDISELNMHSTNKNSAKFQCYLCTSEWKGRRSLERHIRINHTVAPAKTAPATRSRAFRPRSPTTSTETKEQPQKRKKKPSKPSSDTDAETAPVTDLTPFPSLQRVSCPHCPKTYSKAANLRRHITREHDEERYPCVCGKDFSCPENRREHQIKNRCV